MRFFVYETYDMKHTYEVLPNDTQVRVSDDIKNPKDFKFSEED